MPSFFFAAHFSFRTAGYAVAILCLSLLGHAATAQSLKSPNGQLTLSFNLQADGVPTYRLTYKGRDVIKTSKLGLELKNAPALSSGFYP